MFLAYVYGPCCLILNKMMMMMINGKRREIGCQLLLSTNRKLHTGSRLVPKSALNDLKRCNDLRRALSPLAELVVIFDFVLELVGFVSFPMHVKS